MAKVDDALTKSGKKYGAFSGKARRKANAQIAEAKRQQNLVSDINQEAQDAFAASNYSGIGLRNELALRLEKFLIKLEKLMSFKREVR